ncbi:MAG: HEPN domain-containing protein [Paludibacter sp.]|jgi:hypothetical protein|nr:HEPN domain-containing protein [Paludibacter sp.]
MKNLLGLAKEDLDVAKILYKEKKYSNSLYHYHQCVEKVVKYVGLSIGGISETQIKKEISHDPIKVFKFLFKYFCDQSGGLLPPIDTNILTNAKQLIESSSDEEIVNEAQNMLKEICDEENIIKEEQFPSPFDAVCDYFNKVIPGLDLGLDNKLFRKYAAVRLKNETKNTIIFINYGTKILQILLVNVLICSKFKPDEFRYSSEKIGNPVEHFNENNSLIRNLYFFINSMNIPVDFSGKINWKIDSVIKM